MRNYLDLLREVLVSGEETNGIRKDRTGVSTINLFAPRELEFDLEEGFPIVTTKRIAWKSVVWELLFFLRGETSNQWLRQRGVTIWDEWARANGDLGPIYGAQWRRWPGQSGPVDQLRNVIGEIRSNPASRRLVVSAWNPAQIPDMALPPCHVMYQFFVSNGTLSMKMTQRSGDMFLGVPFNISSYALLLSIAAKITGLRPKRLVISLGDAHVYANHVDQVRLQLERQPHALPTLVLPDVASLDEACELTADDCVLEQYVHHPSIRARVAV